jgi:hypothetical protein
MKEIAFACGTCFAAAAVWLTIRIANRREKWAIWTAIAGCFLLPTVYLVGFAIVARTTPVEEIPIDDAGSLVSSHITLIPLPRVFAPIGWLSRRSRIFRRLFGAIARRHDTDVSVFVPASWDGGEFVEL